jgi:hypothetical protein
MSWPDLTFSIDVLVSGTGKDREGILTVDGQRLPYSVPRSMGGKGVGALFTITIAIRR